MTDHVRHSQTKSDTGIGTAPLVTLDVVSHRFVGAGLPRSTRTLQRYCVNGTLECVKEATDTGDTYFVAEPSIDRAITALRQLHEAKSWHRHASTERAVSPDVAPAISAVFPADADRPRPTQSDADAANARSEAADEDRHRPSQSDMSGYVAQLQQRLEEKDEEIAFLREELIDRRGQIKDMKGIIDGQNLLLDTIQTNVAPVFKALASTVERQRIDVGPGMERRNEERREATARNEGESHSSFPATEAQVRENRLL